ncbi:hypothetical protein MBLNU230_g0507t1 [Neophaeotheca triangularis]
MATLSPVARQPFGAIDGPRLQHLNSAKNRQNGLNSQKSPLGSSGKANISASKTTVTTGKRAFSPSPFDDLDGENVDPSSFSSPSKKNKLSAFDTPVKPFTFSLTPSKPMAPSSNTARVSTPARANMSSPRAPLTAPAGRSPKRKTTTSRRISAPYTRVDPPFSRSTGSSSSSMPFSLDAALSGTLSSKAPAPKAAEPSTTAAPMPKNWFFEIYEDSPEEEAATIMEHSTLTLDLSSDEEGRKRERSDKGKENVAPEGYDAVAASRASVATTTTEGVLAAPAMSAPVITKKTNLIRRKIAVETMDDGERAALNDLETEHFYSEGLNKDSHIVVQPEVEQAPVKKPEAFSLLGGSAKAKSKKTKPSPLQDSVLAGDDIPIFEDETVAECETMSPAATAIAKVFGGTGDKRKREASDEGDENAVPVEEATASSCSS